MVEKIEITKRAKVRRNNLSYLRDRSGKSARLKGKDFDRAAVNDTTVEEPVEEVKEETAPVEDVKEVEVVETSVEAAKEEKAE